MLSGLNAYLKCEYCGSNARPIEDSDIDKGDEGGKVVSFKLPKAWHYATTKSILGNDRQMLFCKKRCRKAFDRRIERHEDYKRLQEIGKEAAQAIQGKKVTSIQFTEIDYGPRLEIEFETGHKLRVILHQVRPSFLVTPDGENTVGILPKHGISSWNEARTMIRDGRG